MSDSKDESKEAAKAASSLSTSSSQGPQVAPSGPAAEDDEEPIDIKRVPEMSAEEVDSFLEEDSPEFVKELSAIAKDKDLSFEQIVIENDTAALHAEIDWWKEQKGFLKILFRIIPFAPRVSLKLGRLLFRLKAVAASASVHLKNFGYYLATEGRTKVLGGGKKFLSSCLKFQKEAVGNFKKSSLKAKLVFASSVLLLLLAVFVIYRSWTQGLLPADKEMFLTNLADHASQAYDYEPNATEPYLDNARAFQNIFLTNKIVANLKRPPDSEANPMGAFEFFIEGMSAEVLVEIKDREPFMQDLMQRTIEEMSFEELDTDTGKHDLCKRLQKVISQQLTTGNVKSVRIKTIIIKP